jgi:murein DD-endopeptidase MepM/ murein hydrolase activator NlpD
VTIDHGQERSTYQPVTARVKVGDAVRPGQRIGTLLGSPSHCSGACLHLGRLVGEDYLDPLELLGGGRFRLIDPQGEPPAPPAGIGGHGLQRPVGGPITSPYGMRVHPVTGKRKLHDGTDFGVPCGTPVHAAAGGTGVGRSYSGAYGKRLVVRHRPGFETSYNHLSTQSVSVGDRVTAGQVIARSGTTGLSTGCHLHFMVLTSGKPVNPQEFL